MNNQDFPYISTSNRFGGLQETNASSSSDVLILLQDHAFNKTQAIIFRSSYYKLGSNIYLDSYRWHLTITQV